MKLKKKKEKESNAANKHKADKISPIKGTRLRTVGKVILWIVITFVLIRGIAGIFKTSDASQLQQMVIDYRGELDQREAVARGASAFAASFASEYYTFTGQFNSDYNERIDRYLSKNVIIKEPTQNVVSAEVTESHVLNVNFMSDKQLDVDVMIKVGYKIRQEEAEHSAVIEDVYLRIPVGVDDQLHYAIESVPSLISRPLKADISGGSGFSGTEADGDVKNSVKTMLESFFKVYYEGSRNEITYFVTPDSGIMDTLAGTVEFSRIDALSVVVSSENSKLYKVDASISILDHGQTLQQRLFLQVADDSDRYYIKSISTRAL